MNFDERLAPLQFHSQTDCCHFLVERYNQLLHANVKQKHFKVRANISAKYFLQD